MGIFGKKSKKRQIRIFIVEDSKVYSAQLEFFLQSKFGEGVAITCFPVSEVMDVKLEKKDIPDLIIMDHILNDKYSDAEPGFDALRRIKEAYPGIGLILHSANTTGELAEQCAKEGVCSFVPKGEDGLESIAKIIAEIS